MRCNGLSTNDIILKRWVIICTAPPHPSCATNHPHQRAFSCFCVIQAELRCFFLQVPPVQQYFSVFLIKDVMSSTWQHHLQWKLGKSPRGMGLLFVFLSEASPNKNPTSNFHFFGSFFRFWNMDPKSQTTMARPSKRPKLQQSITSMLQGIGPKFVEATGKQLVCPYCQYKFRAPQGTNSWGLDKVL